MAPEVRYPKTVCGGSFIVCSVVLVVACIMRGSVVWLTIIAMAAIVLTFDEALDLMSCIS